VVLLGGCSSLQRLGFDSRAGYQVGGDPGSITTITREDSSETSTDDVDTVLTNTELENMGWPADIEGVDSGVDRVYVISSSLSKTKVLDTKEAQALAFRAIADVGRQRTADETGVSPSEVGRELRSAERKVTGAWELVEILDDCGH
jgi:hypothetical protein